MENYVCSRCGQMKAKQNFRVSRDLCASCFSKEVKNERYECTCCGDKFKKSVFVESFGVCVLCYRKLKMGQGEKKEEEKPVKQRTFCECCGKPMAKVYLIDGACRKCRNKKDKEKRKAEKKKVTAQKAKKEMLYNSPDEIDSSLSAKKRKCIQCGKEFTSRDDYRTCDSCLSARNRNIWW